MYRHGRDGGIRTLALGLSVEHPVGHDPREKPSRTGETQCYANPPTKARETASRPQSIPANSR
eukprot:2595519-Pyramimonas_sp.AAC.1